MTPTEEELGAFVDGELEPTAQAAIAAAIGKDPALAARVASLEALNRRVRGAFGAALAEPVPARLSAAALGSDAPAVVDLGAARAARRAGTLGLLSARGWMALAASVVVGFVVGHFLWPDRQSGLVAVGERGITAGPALALALSQQLARDPPSADGIAVGLSYRARSGSYCRTFAVAARAGVAGVACHEGDQWHIGALAEGAPESGAAGGYRQAATTLPPALREAVAATIDGDPLDADAELAARQRSWR